jgi:hypothetical protein
MRKSRSPVFKVLVASAVMSLFIIPASGAQAVGAPTPLEKTEIGNTTDVGQTSTRYAQKRGRPSASRPGGGRPSAGRPGGGRPSAGRPGGGRPSAGRPGEGRPSAGRPGGGRNVNINRNVNVTVKHRGAGWRGARWGAVAFGVTMGAVITVAASTPPPPPHSSLCWTWTNSAKTTGYWYYCSGP